MAQLQLLQRGSCFWGAKECPVRLNGSGAVGCCGRRVWKQLVAYVGRVVQACAVPGPSPCPCGGVWCGVSRNLNRSILYRQKSEAEEEGWHDRWGRSEVPPSVQVRQPGKKCSRARACSVFENPETFGKNYE